MCVSVFSVCVFDWDEGDLDYCSALVPLVLFNEFNLSSEYIYMERELDWASEYLCWCVFVMTVCRWERAGWESTVSNKKWLCVCVRYGAGVLEVSLAVAVVRHDCGILISHTFPFSIPLFLSLCHSSVWLHRSWSVCCPPSLIQLWSRWIEMHSDWLLLLNTRICFSSVNSGPCGQQPSILQDVTSSVFEMHTISTSI